MNEIPLIPLIANIQRFSIDDGPGIRTVVFLKGCPLRCPWCHNPEMQSPEVEIYYHELKCTRCGICAETCKQGAIISPGPNGEPPIRVREKCVKCLMCVNACPNQALTFVGQNMTMDEIIQEALSDTPFFKNSGGGVTISGGEALLFPEYVCKLAECLKKEDCHIAIETSGFGKWDDLERLCNYIDLFLYDLKHIDDVVHKKVIGVSNKLILGNLEKLIARDKSIRIRIPIIPGFNMDKAVINKIGDFLVSLGADAIEAVDLLPFHSFAEIKYKQLDKHYKYDGLASLEKESVKDLEEILINKGLVTTIGGQVGVRK
ncbi:MAG: glycyl-radical enzyme activating protein [Thermoanaerobacterium sp.]|nr:glycyl-radical enzyme activating protein [Thermoanaerobacterium sp.]